MEATLSIGVITKSWRILVILTHWIRSFNSKRKKARFRNQSFNSGSKSSNLIALKFGNEGSMPEKKLAFQKRSFDLETKLWFWKRRICLTKKRMTLMDFRITFMNNILTKFFAALSVKYYRSHQYYTCNKIWNAEITISVLKLLSKRNADKQQFSYIFAARFVKYLLSHYQAYALSSIYVIKFIQP